MKFKKEKKNMKTRKLNKKEKQKMLEDLEAETGRCLQNDLVAKKIIDAWKVDSGGNKVLSMADLV